MRVGVLASGSGTILEALLERGLPIAVLVADRPCRALEVAGLAGVAAELVERRDFGPGFDRVAYTHEVVDALERHAVDLVAIAGFGTILSKPFVDAFSGRAVNTHPALLPAFKGWHAVRDALDFGVKVTGCTVHLVTEDVDAGPILAQEAVAVRADDTESSLHERIKEVERRLYPDVVEGLMKHRADAAEPRTAQRGSHEHRADAAEPRTAQRGSHEHRADAAEPRTAQRGSHEQ